MAHDDLRDFIRALEKNNELKRIPFEVDTRLEITEFADRSVKTGGPALLFEKPRLADGSISRIPVLINSFASMRRMEIALEVDSVAEVAKRISERARSAGGPGLKIVCVKAVPFNGVFPIEHSQAWCNS